MINIEKTENEKHLEIYLKMIGKDETDKFELYQLLDLMNIAQDLVKNLALSGVGCSNKVDYKQGFELAQKYIEESPCDPDIYRTQLDAWNDYQQFLIDNNIT